MAKKLNERQEMFCQAVMQGKTQRQAYYQVYPNSKMWKTESVDVRASALRNSDKVAIRLAELQAEAEKQNGISRDDLIGQLKTIGFADIDLNNIKPSEKTKALEVMAKILGYDKPPETPQNIDDVKEESALSTEELRKLAENNPL